MKRKGISQQRIARDLGVSQALVSLVLNGKRENISEESYRRIWDYAIKSGYQPKGMKAQGNHLTTANVGFILRAGLRLYTQSNFFSHVQHGLHVELQGQGYNTVFLGAEDDLSHEALRKKLKRDNLFGIVVMGQVSTDLLKVIREAQPRVVTVSASYPGLCHSIMPNNHQSLELLVNHLVELGHRRFAWVGGNKLLQQNPARRQAMIDALRAHDLTVPTECLVDVESGDRVAGREVAETILKRAPARQIPTAWICLNALMARGVINFLAQKGYQVPKQFSIVAVDATRVCVEEHPEITGASADPERMGAKAAELILREQNPRDEGLLDVMLPTQFTVRESSAKAPA